MNKPYYSNGLAEIYNGKWQDILPALSEGFDKVITSPPYNIIRPGLNDRGYDEYQDGKSNEEYIEDIVSLFGVINRKMNKNGCVLWNMSYGSENTTLMPLTISAVLKQTDFTLADIVVWKKKSAFPNDMSSNKMTRICEFVFVLCRKSEFDTFTSNKKISSIRCNGQKTYSNAFNFFEAKNNDENTNINLATFSTDFVNQLIERYILPTDVVLDMFSGTGTTMTECSEHGIKSIGIEMSEKQCRYSEERLNGIGQDSRKKIENGYVTLF